MLCHVTLTIVRLSTTSMVETQTAVSAEVASRIPHINTLMTHRELNVESLVFLQPYIEHMKFTTYNPDSEENMVKPSTQTHIFSENERSNTTCY